MINLHKRICLLITISVLIIHAAEFDKKFQHLPNTIVELKQYYDVIESLEQRTILETIAAEREKQICIEYASTLTKNGKLLTIEEFRTWKQRETIVTFANIIAVLAGIIVFIALTALISICVLPILVNLPTVIYEVILYLISFSLMFIMSNSWVIFFGCLVFLSAISLSIKLRCWARQDVGLIASWICFFVWSLVAIYQQNQEVGYLAVMALESALGFVMFSGPLMIAIGFQNEKIIPSGTFSSFILMIIGYILYLQKQMNFLTIPFTRPLIFLGTFVYFIGLIILSSRWYRSWQNRRFIFILLQIITFTSGLSMMFFGPMLEIPFIQSIGGTMFVLWLLQKYAEIAPWNDFWLGTCSLLGFGGILYGFAYFLQSHPEYFIFHVYSSK